MTQMKSDPEGEPDVNQVQDIIENEDEEKMLINENALYKHVSLALMPLRMR